MTARGSQPNKLIEYKPAEGFKSPVNDQNLNYPLTTLSNMSYKTKFTNHLSQKSSNFA